MPAYVYKNVRVNKRGKSTPIEIESGGQWFRSSDETFIGASGMPEAARRFEEITEPEFILRLLEQHAESPFVQQQEPGSDAEVAPVELTEGEVIEMAREAFTALLAEISELPRSIEEVKTIVKAKIDTWAGDTRKQFITEVPGQQMTYAEKRQEALAWKASNTLTVEPEEFPFLYNECQSLNKTPSELADEIISNSFLWAQIGSQIESVRMKAKNSIDDSINIGDMLPVIKFAKIKFEEIRAQSQG